MISALLDSGRLLLPVNITETWATHFSSRGWSTPQDQITAGYPIFIQPTLGSSQYQETFDIGTVLANSRVTLSYVGIALAGSVTIIPTIDVSDDNATWQTFAGVTDAYASAFRYVRITLDATQVGTDALYAVSSLNVRLDAKLKNDAGLVSAVAGDASGTVVNFAKEFIAVTSIVLSPAGTTPVTAVYEFPHSAVTGTYAVAANVATINATAHSLVVGQKVRLSFISGTAPSGVYAVASVPDANTYTVALTTANTSGNVSTYPQGLRAYLFNSAGARVSGPVSWSIKGY